MPRRLLLALVAALFATCALGVQPGSPPAMSRSATSPRSPQNRSGAARNPTAGKGVARRQKIDRVDLRALIDRYPAPPIAARAAILVDLETGAVLYAKNADERLPMASTTKITTAVLALEHGHLGDLVPVSGRAASIGESTMGLQRGEWLTVRDLLYGLLLNSGNDAAIALAEHVSGTVERFVRQMNLLSRVLGMRNTHYVTPHGLDEPGHFSSARDLGIIARYAMRDATFRRIVDTESYHVPATRHNREHWLANVNRVMYWYPGVDGIKPGDTDNAGLCQVVSAQRDGRHLIAVLLNTPTLVNDIRNLLNFGFQDFRWIQAAAWWDSPASEAAGGSGTRAWSYYYGAGHYVRGPFLHYFSTHGGLQTLGYPRSEAIDVDGVREQIFQGQALAYDGRSGNAYPIDLGRTLGRRLLRNSRNAGRRPGVARALRGEYGLRGGKGVFGKPVTPLMVVEGTPVQFYRYGALGIVHGMPSVIPLGDVEMRVHDWFPSKGASDAFASGMAASAEGPLVAVARPNAVTRQFHDARIRSGRRRGARGHSSGRRNQKRTHTTATR